MNDDIVTRLRDKHGEFRIIVGFNQNVLIDTIYGEAADEIERLRADRDNWKDLASEYYHLDPKCECHLCDRFREATNGGDR